MYFEKNKWNVWIKVWAFKSPSALASVKWCWTNVSKCLLVSREISFISLLEFGDVVTGDLPLHVNTKQASNYTVYRREALEKLLIFLILIKNMWSVAGKCQGCLWGGRAQSRLQDTFIKLWYKCAVTNRVVLRSHGADDVRGWRSQILFSSDPYLWFTSTQHPN